MLWKPKKDKEREQLEDKVMRFMRKADSLKETNPKLAYRFLLQTQRLYSQLGYSKKIETEFNDICISFIKRYPSKFKPNLRLTQDYSLQPTN